MSAKANIVKTETLRFLQTGDPEVLCVRGKWGVGKTYSWKQNLRESYLGGQVKLERYAYVSLFGVNSLDELKYSIFENTVKGNHITADANIDTFRATLEAAEGLSRKYAWLLNVVPGLKTYFGSASPAFFLTVRNQIICIDDLERRGSGLQINDVLGLVSFLREQRQCKVVLLFNDEAFETADKESLQRYLEKVVDASIAFAPTSVECADIALEGKTDADAELRKHCVSLGISNIRVIKKIERLAGLLAPLLAEFDPDIHSDALKSITLFTWILYTPNDAPTKEFVVKRRADAFLGLVDEKLTVQEEAWNDKLDSYDFAYCSDFDLLLLESIEQGFFDPARVAEEGAKVNEQHLAALGERSLRKAWGPLRDSFDDNSLEVVESVYSGCRSQIRFLSFNTLDAAVRLLKELHAGTRAAELLSEFVLRRAEDIAEFDVDGGSYGIEIQDPDVIQAFRENGKAINKLRSPIDALKNIGSGGWSSLDLEALYPFSANDFFQLFKSLRGRELSDAVSSIMKYDRTGNLEARDRAICTAAKEALSRIANENPLNLIRVRRFGLRID